MFGGKDTEDLPLPEYEYDDSNKTEIELVDELK